MISCISGLPGKGKNVYATYLAKKHFKHENSLLKKHFSSVKYENLYVKYIYHKYRILLDNKNNLHLTWHTNCC